MSTEKDPTKINRLKMADHTVQEAQLSQRDRSVLNVIEYFTKSLIITRGHSK